MLILRAFPLSLAIAWRFIVTFPLWVIFYVLMSTGLYFALLLSVSIAIAIPVLGAVVAMGVPLIGFALVLVFLIHPYLIATRIGLKVLGVKTEPSEKRLLGAAACYGLVGQILNFLIVAIITIPFIVLLRDGSFAFALRMSKPILDPISNLSEGIAWGSMTILATLTTTAILALRAAMLPVLANVAAGRDPKGHFYTPARGFGQGFASMFALMIIIILISTVIIRFVSGVSGYLGLSNLLTEQLHAIVSSATNFDSAPLGLVQTSLIILAILIAAGLFCLQCAGAALNYESRSIRTPDEKEAIIAAQKVQSQEIGDLLRSRMPNTTRQ